MTRLAFIIAATLALPALSHAGDDSDQDRARALSNAGTIVPLERITAQVRERHIGHILEVELETEGAAYFYEIEVVDDAGVVRKLRYDAVSGKLIGEAVDD